MKKIIYAVLLLWAVSCKESYNIPFTIPANGYLVVDGIINSGQGPTTIRLTRTVGLGDAVTIKPEFNAFVSVEGEDNSTQLLSEGQQGVYSTDQLNISSNIQYRLRIRTTEGKEYLSEYSNARRTPPIDTIGWERTDGVELFVNTHDPQNNTWYYRWEYEETWEFRSYYFSTLKYQYDATGKPVSVTTRDTAESADMFTCYQFENSAGLLIGSSAKLSRDTIHFSLLNIPPASWKLGVLYSLYVKQYALSPEGYEYLRRMKKNTEQVGSIFDAQPSELIGNIQCTGNPGEVVIGYVEVSDLRDKRIFIKRSEVPLWGYRQYCTEQLVENKPDSIEAVFYTLLPTTIAEEDPPGNIVEFYASTYYCVDCRLRGTHVKPPYWP